MATQADRSVQLVFDLPATNGPAARAVAEVEQVLKERGVGVSRATDSVERVSAQLIVGLAGKSPAVDRALREQNVSVPDAPESLLIRRIPSTNPTRILIAGRDERGLAYALREAAQAFRLAPAGADPLSALGDACESPFVAYRSISVHLMNADLERSWYFDENYWEQYFAMLMRNRFNTVILTFADQCNYMAPPYPWLFDLSEYPAVRVEGLRREEQAANLAMLRRIGEVATADGLDFAIAIWQQQPVVDKHVPPGPYARNFGHSSLRHLPQGAELVDYSAKALARLLSECPSIHRLQLRLNDESGIPEAMQPDYFRALFAVLKSQPRPVELDLRYKGLKQETIDQAVATGLAVTVSTKFWCEHLGLPFHPTTQDPLYSASRYGYGTLLRRPRNYNVAYQLWNQGSSRILTWGDPDYAARFAQSCVLGDGDGFEVSAPMTDRGWGNEPGAWRLLARPELEYYRWESERYWLFPLAFGRMGYDPNTAPAVWDREFVARFGTAAEDVERGYRYASRILPLLTASGMTSASEWSYWPEMDLGGSLEVCSVTPPSDTGQFYGIRAWKAVPGWTYGGWSGTVKGFVEDALAGDVEAKWTPIQVADELDRLAEGSLAAIDAAVLKAGGAPGAEFRATAVDIRALAWLARYHAARKRAATHLAFFHATQEAGRLVKVRDYAEEATKAWQALSRVTDGVYSDNLVFGRAREVVGTREKPVNAHAGHWKDRLPNVQADLDYARKLLAEYNGEGKTSRVYPGEVPPARLPTIAHTPVTSSVAGTAITIEARIESQQPLKKVLLRFRPMDQTQPWTVIPMQAEGEGRYRAAIPGNRCDASCDMLYYLEARVEGGGTLWPDWRKQTPYVKVAVRKDSR